MISHVVRAVAELAAAPTSAGLGAATDGSAPICLWESDSVEAVQEHVDSRLDDSSVNTCCEVDADEAFSEQPLGLQTPAAIRGCLRFPGLAPGPQRPAEVPGPEESPAAGPVRRSNVVDRVLGDECRWQAADGSPSSGKWTYRCADGTGGHPIPAHGSFDTVPVPEDDGAVFASAVSGLRSSQS